MRNITNQLLEISKAGQGISKDLFEYLLEDMTDNAKEIAECYEEYFDDIVGGAEQYVDFETAGDFETDKNRWFETTYASLCKIKGLYGNEICKTIADSVVDNTFLYPYEMKKAAEYLHNGGNSADFGELIEKGTLDDDAWGFPKIKDLTEEKEYLDYKKLPEARAREILDGALDYLSELLKGRELYNVLSGSVGMTNEEIEYAGFTLQNYYADENEDEENEI